MDDAELMDDAGTPPGGEAVDANATEPVADSVESEAGGRVAGEVAVGASEVPVLPLRRSWTWFGHTNAGNYDESTVPFGTFSDVNQFFAYHNHVPAPDAVFDGVHALRLSKGGCLVMGFSVFLDGVSPAWEDPVNLGGADLCARLQLGKEELPVLAELWRNATLALVNEELGEEVVGVRLTHRIDHRSGAVTHKFEVWLRTPDVPEGLPDSLAALCAAPLDFQLVRHESSVAMARQATVPKPRRRQRARDARAASS